MSDIGLLFCDDMIRACLRDIDPKGLTRRTRGLETINEAPDEWEIFDHIYSAVGTHSWIFRNKATGLKVTIKSPIAVGDIIYAKEVHAFEKRLDHLSASQIGNAATVGIWYKVGDTQLENPNIECGRWRSAMFMPRWAARIRRPVTGIICQRVQSITEADAKAEGVAYCRQAPNETGLFGYRLGFMNLWDRLNGKKHPWEFNPWVFAYSLAKEVQR